MRVWRANGATTVQSVEPVVRVYTDKGGCKRLSISAAACALLGISVGDRVVVLTDRGLATVSRGVGAGDAMTVAAHSMKASLTCTGIPDEDLPIGTFKLRLGRLGWAWGKDAAEAEAEQVDDIVESIVGLPVWDPVTGSVEW